MKREILSLFCVVLAATLLRLLLSNGESKGLRRAVSFFLSLAVLLLILHPFLGILQNPPELAFENLVGETKEDATAHFEEVLHAAVEAGSVRDLKEGVYLLLLEEFSVAREDATIFVTLDETGALSRVEVRLSGKALLVDPVPVKERLLEKLNCEVEVR